MAIAAQLEILSDSSGKRRKPRRTIRLETRGASASGEVANVTIHNISASGLLLECDRPLGVGDELAIELPDAGPINATIVWESGVLRGCRFGSPIPDAVLSAAELRSAVRLEPGMAAAPAAPRESFGARIQRLRKERGLPMARVASELGVSKPTVWAWEQGRAKPVKSRIEALAGVLGVTSRELLTGHDDDGLDDLLSLSREKIADAFGTGPESVRIMIEI